MILYIHQKVVCGWFAGGETAGVDGWIWGELAAEQAVNAKLSNRIAIREKKVLYIVLAGVTASLDQVETELTGSSIAL